MKFPLKQLPEPRDEVVAKRIVYAVVLVTLLPSIYFGYDIVQQNHFRQRANRFIDNEAIFPNDYLLKKTVDAAKREITLTYGGEFIEESEVENLRNKLPNYELDSVKLDVRQGFAYLREDKTEEDEQTKQLNALLTEKETQMRTLKAKVDAIAANEALGQQVCSELKVQFEHIELCAIQQATVYGAEQPSQTRVAVLSSNEKINDKDRAKLAEWLKVRTKTDSVTVHIDTTTPN
jgi:hypothetical protein